MISKLQNRLGYIAWNVLMAILIMGCRSQRAVPDITQRSSKHEITRMLDNSGSRFRTLKARKMEADFLFNGKMQKVRGNLAIYRDSMIAVSVVPALGYEVLRILCSSDSVIIINRPDKVYMASSFNRFRKKYKLPVDFYDIQSILANEVFRYGDNTSAWVMNKGGTKGKVSFSISVSEAGKTISMQEIIINKDIPSYERCQVFDAGLGIDIRLDYEEFFRRETVVFPNKTNIKMNDGKNQIGLEMDYGQLVFDDSIRLEFEVPENYKREKFF